MEHATTQPKQAATDAGGKQKLEEEQKLIEAPKQGVCATRGAHVCEQAGGKEHAGHEQEAHKAEQGAAKVGEEHKTAEVCKATTAAPSRRGHVEEKARQSDAPVRVLDCMHRELFELSPADVQKHDVKWLKQQVLSKKNMELKAGEEMLLYTRFEQWLKDDEPLSKALGDRPCVYFFRHIPHSGSFQVNLKQEGVEKSISITAHDGEKIICLKERIAKDHRIPAAHQRLFFLDVLLDDNHTVNDYKLPAECTLELDVVPV